VSARTFEREAMTGTNQRSRHARALALAPLLVLALASVAQADPDPLAKPANAVAREHLTTGNRLYRLRELEKAIEEYKAGAVREDVPVFHYNLGHCYRLLGRYADAIWQYETFLDRGKPTGVVEASVRDFIAQMKGELEKQAMKQPPVEPAPPPSAVSRSPGQQRPMAPRAEASPGMPPRRKLAIGVGVGGVAAIGLGIGLGIRARGFEADADTLCPMMDCASAAEANALLDRGKTNAIYANLSLAVGAVATIGAVVLWLTGKPSRESRAAILPGVSGSNAHAGLTAIGWFW
jgi:tetratricopeptide (TPR) repeat protein